MFKFISIRLIQFPLILAVIYLATFMLAWVAPGDPLQRTERPLSAQARKALEEKYHVKDTWTFLSHYPFQMVKGDFGPSFSSDSLTVGQIIKHGLPVSMGIGMLAMVIAITCGVSIGTVAAVARGKVFDWLSISVALVGVSVPSFVIAVALRTVFAYHIDAFPAGNWPAGIERNLLGGPFTGFKWMLDEQGSQWIA
ncbi:MAG TPA: hypothetical protein PK402_13905, partial [Tepidisphaeraceae bacterium]|nr:hypothetical protein [Tepidisphaeraceae bacterium]